MSDNELLLAISEMMDTKLDAKFAPIEDSITRIEDRVSGIEDRVSGIEDKVIRIEDRVSGIEDRVSGIEDKVSGIEDRVSGIEDRVSGIEDSVTSIESRVTRIEVDLLENNVLPRLNTIESCYTDTFNRYKDGAEHMSSVVEDVALLKKVVAEHSEKLQAIS